MLGVFTQPQRLDDLLSPRPAREQSCDVMIDVLYASIALNNATSAGPQTQP